MSAFILLPFAATTQNLSSSTSAATKSKAPTPEEQARKNNCIESAASCIDTYASLLMTPSSDPLSLLSEESFRNALISLVMSLPNSPTPTSDACTVALFKTIVRLTSSSSSSSQPLSSKLDSSLPPPLIASITQTSLSVSKHTPNRDASHQLAAMSTMKHIIRTVPKHDLWVAIFPGTVGGVFKVLYDSITSKYKDHALASMCIETFQVLLEVVCDDSSNGLEVKVPTIDNLFSKPSPTPTPNPASPNPLLDLKLARSNLTPLLTLILHNTRLHSSLKLRLSCASLSSSILLKSRLTLSPLIETLFDTLVILTRDDMEGVREKVNEGLRKVKGSMKESSWRDLRVTQIVSRILSLLPLTSTLLSHAPSLSSHVKLLTGYFHLCSNLAFFNVPHNAKLLVDALCQTFQPSMTSSLSSDGKGVMAFKNSSGFYLPKFKHLTNDELAEACYEMVRTVAGKLEEGQGGANVVEEILERVEGWRGKGGERGSKYGGSGVVLCTFLTGLKSCPPDVAWSIASRTISSKGWSSPACFEEVKGAGGEDEGEEEFEDWMRRKKKGRKKRRKIRRAIGYEVGEGETGNQLENNAYFISSLLSVMSALPGLCDGEFNNLLPTILYSIICKAGCGHNVVRMAAVECLNSMAVGGGFGDIKTLIIDNMDYLADGFVNSTRLSMRGGGGNGGVLEGVVNVLLGYGCSLPILVDVVKACLAEVDGMRGTEREEGKVVSVLNILGCIVKSVEGGTEGMGRKVEGKKVEGGGLGRLIERYGDENIVLEGVCDNVQDGEVEGFFKDYHENKGKGEDAEAQNQQSSDHQQSSEEEGSGEDKKKTASQSRILRLVLDRVCYYLPLPSLSISVASFSVATACFEALEKIGNTDGKGDPLLMAVNEVWKGVVASVLSRRGMGGGKEKRGRAYLEIEGKGKSSGVDVVDMTLLRKTYYDSPSGQDKRLGFAAGDSETKERVLFACLFNLAGYLCREAGDFMDRRVDEIFQLGGIVLSRQARIGGNGKDRELVLSALRCFTDIFRHCGEGVEGKVEVATAMVVGWLRDKGEVGGQAEECLKVMCGLDFEGVWEGLVKGGGERGIGVVRWFEQGSDERSESRLG